MKSRLLSACTGIALLGFHLEGLALSPPAVHALVARSVAALQALDESGQPRAAFSATALDERRFVSVCDGVDQAPALRLTLGGRQTVATVVARDRERNLCLLDAAEALGPPLLRRPALPAVGQRVFAISNALGLGVGISEGVVAGIRNGPRGQLIQFTAPISPGSEGGALVDDEGRLVAVLDYRRRDGQNVNFGAPLAWLDDIAARSAAAALQLQRFDAATALAQQQQWQALAEHATAWLAGQPDQVDALRFSIAAAQGLQQPDAVLAGWRALRRLQPDDASAGLGLGQTLLARRETEEAVALARALAAAHADDARVHSFLGGALQSAGDVRQAESAYRQAVVLDPGRLEAHAALAELAQGRGDAAAAIAIWARLTGLQPAALNFKIRLARAYVLAGRSAEAHAEILRWPPAQRDSGPAWLWRAIALLNMGLPDAAQQAAQQALAQGDVDQGWAWGTVGLAMVRMSRYPEAIEALRTAMRLDPADPRWPAMLGVHLLDGGRPEEGLQVAQELSTREPGKAGHWELLGLALFRLERNAEAAEALERALQLAPRERNFWRHLIAVYQQLGRRQDARQALARLREIDPGAAETSDRKWILPYEEARP